MIYAQSLVCPCGQTIEETSSWPPYRTFTTVHGEVVFAICIHGCVVVDKRNLVDTCCGKQMGLVDGWKVCTVCWRRFKNDATNTY